MKKKNVALFYNKLLGNFGGMEIHGDNFINYFNNNNQYNLKVIISKKENLNYAIIGNKVHLINLETKCKELEEIDIFFFNSGHWISQIELLHNNYKTTKFIYRTGGNEIIKAPLKNVLKHKERQKYWVKIINNYIDAIITNSEYSEKRLSNLGISAKLFQRNVGGVNVGLIRAIKNNSIIENSAKTKFVCASRFVHYKNHDKLISVFKKLNNLNIDFELILIGDGQLYENIKKESLNLVKLKKVQFKGIMSNEDVLNEIIKADYYIQFSSEYKVEVENGFYIHAEGMGRSILEAISCHTFVITTNSGALAEIVNDNNGILVNLDNEEQIVQQIKKLINNKIINTELIDDKYSWELFFNKYVSLFEKLDPNE